MSALTSKSKKVGSELRQRMVSTVRSSKSHRWDLMGKYYVEVNGKVFLNRLRVILTPWFGVYFTRIYGPDLDRSPHNHSRWFATFILSGSYVEERWVIPEMTSLGTRCHRRFSIKVMRRDQAHNITKMNSAVRTLVLCGPHYDSFKFWTPEGPVDWRDYK